MTIIPVIFLFGSVLTSQVQAAEIPPSNSEEITEFSTFTFSDSVGVILELY